MVLAMADDPGMHSSQNEQDSRYLARFALIPCLEPANQQEAYEMTRAAFELSEKHHIPVLVRVPTRLAHSRADVLVGERRPQNPLNPTAGRSVFTLLPTNARVQYKALCDKQPAIEKDTEESSYNRLRLDAPDKSRAIITNGIAVNYAREAFGGTIPHPHLHVGQYPLPMGKLRRLVASADEIVVIEEGYPLIEEALRGVVGVPGKRIRGKLDGTVPRTGELSPSVVSRSLGMEVAVPYGPTLSPLPNRPPMLCPGCPHGETFQTIKEVLAPYGTGKVFSDIGCYTLGFYPPYQSVDTCIDMGASITLGTGAAHAGIHPVICTIGDSTFAHSGMTGLITAAHENVNSTVVIMDNGIVAMTGLQETLLTGEQLVKVVEALGVDPRHIRVISPLPKNREENVRVFKEEIDYDGLSVIISRRPCIQVRKKG
jgi:indolepyruvate ferredoxin oxidoreductase alpha subunit